jgi:hypothetical protein
MNQRIKELLNEAEKSVTFLSNSNESKHQIAMQRFAELIIRECAGVVAEHFDPSEPWITPKTILYHFGVEE